MKFLKCLGVAVLCYIIVFMSFGAVSYIFVRLIGLSTTTYAIILNVICGFATYIFLMCGLSICVNKHKKRQNIQRLKFKHLGIDVAISLSCTLALLNYSLEAKNIPCQYQRFGPNTIMKKNHGCSGLYSVRGKELVPMGDYSWSQYDIILEVFNFEIGKQYYLAVTTRAASVKNEPDYMDIYVYDEGKLIAVHNLRGLKFEKDYDYTLEEYFEEFVGRPTNSDLNTPFLEYVYPYYRVMDYDMSVYENEPEPEPEPINKKGANDDYHPHSNSDVSEVQYNNGPEYETVDEWIPCFSCNGTGFCSACKGSGETVVTNYSGDVINVTTCIVCSGSGKCQQCYGTRGHYEKRLHQIR